MKIPGSRTFREAKNFGNLNFLEDEINFISGNLKFREAQFARIPKFLGRLKFREAKISRKPKILVV